ncbi:MAG: elongation factor-1 alpha, partial [Methylophilaceae bacterium]
MKFTPSNMTWLNLPNMPSPIKALFAGYLLAIGVGLLMAGLQIMLTHGMADGEVGLSVDDIVYSYYGDRTHSKIASKLSGSMKDKAPLEIKREITSWVQDGTPEAEWDSH